MKKKCDSPSRRNLFIMSAVPLIFIIVFYLIPILGNVIAFKDYKLGRGMIKSDWAGFSNIRFILESRDFLNVLKNTVFYNTVFTVLGIAAALAAAVMVYNLKSGRMKKIYQAALIIPYLISWVFAGEILNLIIGENGAVNHLLALFSKEPVMFYAKPGVWPWIMVIFYLWKNTGFSALVFYCALCSVKKELFEAARVDGASEKRVFFSIMLPSIMPAVIILIILNAGNILASDCDMFLQLTRENGILLNITDVLDTYIIRNIAGSNMSISSAAGLIRSAAGGIGVAAVYLIFGKKSLGEYL